MNTFVNSSEHIRVAQHDLMPTEKLEGVFYLHFDDSNGLIAVTSLRLLFYRGNELVRGLSWSGSVRNPVLVKSAPYQDVSNVACDEGSATTRTTNSNKFLFVTLRDGTNYSLRLPDDRESAMSSVRMARNLIAGHLASTFRPPAPLPPSRRQAQPPQNALSPTSTTQGSPQLAPVQAPASPLQATAEAATDMKRCPDCAELVQPLARVCRYCRYDFTAAEVVPSTGADTLRLAQLPRHKLAELITRYGPTLSDEPRRLEALLRDVCGEHRVEIRVLVAAVSEDVPQDLLHDSTGMPKEILFARLQKRLCENAGLAPEPATWAVESWAIALGIIAP